MFNRKKNREKEEKKKEYKKILKEKKDYKITDEDILNFKKKFYIEGKEITDKDYLRVAYQQVLEDYNNATNKQEMIKINKILSEIVEFIIVEKNKEYYKKKIASLEKSLNKEEVEIIKKEVMVRKKTKKL